MMNSKVEDNLIEGTLINIATLNNFGDKLVSKFLNETQSEMGVVLQNISNLKNIFIQALLNYKEIN